MPRLHHHETNSSSTTLVGASTSSAIVAAPSAFVPDSSHNNSSILQLSRRLQQSSSPLHAPQEPQLQLNAPTPHHHDTNGIVIDADDPQSWLFMKADPATPSPPPSSKRNAWTRRLVVTKQPVSEFYKDEGALRLLFTWL